jgi:L-tartrate/succinate antiporter
VTRGELVMAAVAVLALALWIFGGAWLSPTTVALAAFGLMLVTGVLDWADVLGDRDAWNVVIWFATLVTLADGFNVTGFLPWFAGRAAATLAGVPATAMLLLLVAVFFAAHYLFASLTAHTTALLPVFLAAGAAVPGMRLRVLALALCYAVGLMGVLTPYATGPAPIYFASGYISRKAFWTLGLVFGAIYLLALMAIGVPYLLAVSP